MSQRDYCIINKVHKGNNLLNPNMINFDYGALSNQEDKNIQCEMYVDKNNLTDKTLILSRQGKRYMGIPENMEKSLCQTILLVRNKKTNEGRVIPFESCTLLNVNPKKRKSLIDSSSTEFNYKDGINTLSKAFGSKKSRRITDMQQRMDRTNQMIETDMTQEMGEITFDEIDNTMKGAKIALLNLIPPCNRNATCVSDVYPIDKLLSPEEQKSLEAAVQYLKDNPPKESDQITSYFLYSQYQLLGANPDNLKLSLLIYGNAIVKFLHLSISEVKQKSCANVICPFSNILGNKILNNFTIQTEQGRSRPLNLKDKAVCYLLVIMLLINNYTVSLDVLTSTIKGFQITKLQRLVKLLGLTSLTGSSKQYVLKLPLQPLPIAKKARISKK